MRHLPLEKAEIIRIVERSDLPVKQTLAKLVIPRTTFYRWCDLLRLGGINALEDHRLLPGHVWNRVPDNIRCQIVDMALDIPELSVRELAVRFTDKSAILYQYPQSIGYSRPMT
jgi:putative transposase